MNKQGQPLSDAELEKELQDQKKEYFEKNNILQTGNRKLYMKTIVLFVSLLTLYTTLVFFTPPTWLSLILCGILGINLASIGFNVMHDGGHESYSPRRWINKLMGYSLNFMGGSAYLWHWKHNVQHHVFTNVEGQDDDIDIKPWIRVHREQPWHWYHCWQHWYWVILYFATYLLWIYIQDFKKYFSGKIGDAPLRKMNLKEHFIFWISKIVYVCIFIVVPILRVGVTETIVGYLVMSGVCGFIIAVVFQLAHIVPDVSFPEKRDSNTMRHQLETTADFATQSTIVTWFLGGLNFQVEHHLFPRVSHVHYPELHTIVVNICKKYDLPHHEYKTVLDAVSAHVQQLKTIGAKE
jgi:linoleoyl-CoA desaturase